jgi:hypothetical protein
MVTLDSSNNVVGAAAVLTVNI